jgi:hypothetical protein
MWLKEADKRDQHRLPDRAEHFIDTYLHSNASSNASTAASTAASNTLNSKHRTSIALPSSLHSLSKVVIHCLGWEDLNQELPILTEEEERKFLSIMLEELNVKFALQLDANPSTKCFGFDTDDSETESAFTIVLAGGSHSSRLEGPLADTYLRVVDVSVPGFRITEESVIGCARIAKKIFSLISEIKRIWIRFTCVSLFHYKISLLFFRFSLQIFCFASLK